MKVLYCPSCAWKWNVKFPELDTNTICNCPLTHDCFSIHEKDDIVVHYNRKMSEMYNICRDCSKCHMTNIAKGFPITIECTAMNMDKEFCKSWNTP